jgi:hypothetical protein
VASSAAGGWLCIVAAVVAGLAVPAVAASPVGAAKPRLHTASYRDAGGEDAQAADITRVVVADDRKTLTFRVWIVNLPQAMSGMGLQIVIDSDRRQATGNQYLVYSLGAEYLIQMIGGAARLLRWDRASQRWLAGSVQPSWSYGSGRATVRLPASAVRNPSDFLFEVSTASGLIVDGDGTVDITTAHFDFAPNVGGGGWRFRARSP